MLKNAVMAVMAFLEGWVVGGGGLSLIVYLSNNGNLHSVQLTHGRVQRDTCVDVLGGN